jgi:hypothetical protein
MVSAVGYFLAFLASHVVSLFGRVPVAWSKPPSSALTTPTNFASPILVATLAFLRAPQHPFVLVLLRQLRSLPSSAGHRLANYAHRFQHCPRKFRSFTTPGFCQFA